MTLLVCESCKCETHKLRESQAWQYIAFFPSCETRETRETCTDIFARSESHFPQNSRKKNCETDSLSTLVKKDAKTIFYDSNVMIWKRTLLATSAILYIDFQQVSERDRQHTVKFQEIFYLCFFSLNETILFVHLIVKLKNFIIYRKHRTGRNIEF